MADESTIVLGRLPERLNKYKNNDAFMCIVLPDGSTGQILLKNGKAVLYSKDGEIDLDGYKDKYGNYTSNFMITGSLQFDGDLIANNEKAKLYFPNIKHGLMYLDENHVVRSTELLEKSFDKVVEKNIEYHIPMINLKSPTAKVKQFVDDNFVFVPESETLKIKNFVTEKLQTKVIDVENHVSFSVADNIKSRIKDDGTYEILDLDGYSAVFITNDNFEITNRIPFRNYNAKASAGLFKNGLGFLIGNTDAGWIRAINDGNNKGTLEIAVGDDGNEENIVFRKYDIYNKVVFELSVDDIAKKEDIKELQNKKIPTVIHNIPSVEELNKDDNFASSPKWVYNLISNQASAEVNDIITKSLKNRLSSWLSAQGDYNDTDTSRGIGLVKTVNRIPNMLECEKNEPWAASPNWVYQLLMGTAKEDVNKNITEALVKRIINSHNFILKIDDFKMDKQNYIKLNFGLIVLQFGSYDVTSQTGKCDFAKNFYDVNYTLITSVSATSPNYITVTKQTTKSFEYILKENIPTKISYFAILFTI